MFGIDDALLAAAIASAASGAAGVASAGSNQDAIRGLTQDQIRMSQATRRDAYGNETRYNPATNTWETILTPEQQALAYAGEREQRLGLTEDAVRNRTIRERLAEMGGQAAGDYGKARAGYEYGHVPSEEATRAEIMRLLQQSQGTGDRATANLVDRMALRQNKNMPVINTGQPGVDVGAKLSDQMLKARSQALQEYGGRQKQKSEQYLPRIQMDAQEAGLGGNANFSLPTVSKEKSDEIEKAIANANSAYTGATGATNNAASITNKAWTSLATNLARSRLGGGKGGSSSAGQPLDLWGVGNSRPQSYGDNLDYDMLDSYSSQRPYRAPAPDVQSGPASFNDRFYF